MIWAAGLAHLGSRQEAFKFGLVLSGDGLVLRVLGFRRSGLERKSCVSDDKALGYKQVPAQYRGLHTS